MRNEKLYQTRRVWLWHSKLQIDGMSILFFTRCFNVEELSKHEKYEDFNRKTIDLIVSEARNLAIKEMLPTQVIGDRQGVCFENGS